MNITTSLDKNSLIKDTPSDALEPKCPLCPLLKELTVLQCLATLATCKVETKQLANHCMNSSSYILQSWWFMIGPLLYKEGVINACSLFKHQSILHKITRLKTSSYSQKWINTNPSAYYFGDNG